MGDISRAFQNAFQRLEETGSSLGHDDQVKLLQHTLSEIHRTVSYTAHEMRQKNAVEICAPIFVGLLVGVAGVLPKSSEAKRRSQLRKRGDKLLRLLSTSGMSTPPSLVGMFDAPALSSANA